MGIFTDDGHQEVQCPCTVVMRMEPPEAMSRSRCCIYCRRKLIPAKLGNDAEVEMLKDQLSRAKEAMGRQAAENGRLYDEPWSSGD
jgi:hypothetical protein